MRARLLWTLLLVASPAAARAQPAADEASLRRAVVLFEESETLYNQGEFVQAAALLRRAYALHADATLLFNLGRALEGAGDLDGAIDAYARYLAEAADPPDRGAVEARLATLRAQREALSERGASEVDDADRAPIAASTASGGGIDPAPWVVLGVGLAALGVGIGLGVAMQGVSDRAATEPVQREAQALYDEAQGLAIGANVLFVVGGLAATAGLVWGVVTLADGGGDATAHLRFGPGSVAVAGTF